MNHYRNFLESILCVYSYRIPLTAQSTKASGSPSQPHVLYLRSDCHCINHSTTDTINIRWPYLHCPQYAR
jgi:hypothetical protein